MLDEIRQLASTAETNKSSHERYLALYRLVQDRDEVLAAAFNNPRRSTAAVQLARIRAEGLLTDEEFAQLGEIAKKVLAAQGIKVVIPNGPGCPPSATDCSASG